MSQSDPDIAKQSIASKIWAEKYLISLVAIHHFKFGPRLVISKHIMEQINRKDTDSHLHTIVWGYNIKSLWPMF